MTHWVSFSFLHTWPPGAIPGDSGRRCPGSPWTDHSGSGGSALCSVRSHQPPGCLLSIETHLDGQNRQEDIPLTKTIVPNSGGSSEKKDHSLSRRTRKFQCEDAAKVLAPSAPEVLLYSWPRSLPTTTSLLLLWPLCAQHQLYCTPKVILMYVISCWHNQVLKMTLAHKVHTKDNH